MPVPPQKRSYYRITYTPGACPKFKFSATNFDVLDLSEQGFRFSITGVGGIKEGMPIHGVITFKDGESVLVHGTVKRINSSEASVLLKKPFPLRKIMEEQRLLIAKTGT